MTDEAFAALERRLGPVLAEGGRGRVDRHDVLGLLEECRRLRRPPDAAGLMPAAELARVRAWADEGPSSAPAALARLLAHADALGSLARELYGVVADLHADDPGRQALFERGRAEGRGQAAALAEAEAARWAEGPGATTDAEAVLRWSAYRGAARQVAVKIRALGPCRPPLPPHAAEAEAGRLREALLAVVAARDGYDRYEASRDEVCGAIDAARKVLGEDAR